jgi:Flp pilus assembly protein CpaB
MQATTSFARGADRRILFFALALGLLSAVLVIAYLRSVEGRARVTDQGIPTRPIIVARGEIPAGQKITPSMLEVRGIPANIIAVDALSSVEQVVGQTARYPFSPGEQISAARLLNATNGQALSFQIPTGMRAFTMPVNADRSPASMLVPGDFVDVLALMSADDLGVRAAGAPANVEGVATVLQNVQVLAVETQFVANGIPYDDTLRGTPSRQVANDITLAVTPEEAQYLTLVIQRARLLTVSLRPFADAQTHDIAPATGPIRFGPDRPTLP